MDSGRRTHPDPTSQETLRGAGLRATGPRLLILEALATDRTHPTPERLHERLRAAYPSLSLSTVYQTLETFVRAGLCRRVQTRDGRLRVDGTPRDHDHAVCRGCGAIFDVERGSRRSRPAAAGLPDDWTVVDVRVEYDIVCARCSAAGAGERGGAAT